MKTMLFDLSQQAPQLADGVAPPHTQQFNVSGLNAYAIASAIIQQNGITSIVDNVNSRIIGSILECNDFNICRPDALTLQIYYHGIRDYAALFPSVLGSDPLRAERIGKFYEEAEKCFEEQAWLSFMLMSAAIFEHLLYYKLGSPNNMTTLSALNNRAKQIGAITQQAYNVIKTTKDARNVIHCNQMGVQYISRAQALDAKTVIDELMRSF